MAFTVGSTPFGIFDSDAAFQSDADKLVDYTRRKLGDPVMLVHLSSSQVYASFEESCLEYSATVNAYQAKSVLSQFLGAPTGSLSGSEQSYPSRLLEFQKKLAEPYGEEVGLNGPHELKSGSVDLVVGQQKYDLQALFSGSVGGKRVRPKRIFHYSPLQAFRFFGTTSAINYLHNQFSFESFTPETIFYLLPIWEDILRGMQFETSNRVRRSNYSYELRNNVLTVYPIPTQAIKLWVEYAVDPDPGAAANAAEASALRGVANLANIPFGNISYSKLNSISKHWIRRMTFALAKEVEGQIRGKFSTVPIPNGDLTLNGPELISDARAEQDSLRTELRDIMEDLTYDKLAAREAEMAESLQRTLREVPTMIYVGVFLLGLSSVAALVPT